MSEPANRIRTWIEEEGYRESCDAIGDARRADELTAAAIALIERNAENQPQVTDDPLWAGHGPLQVAAGSINPDEPDIEIFFTRRLPDDDVCALWYARVVPSD